VPEIRRSGILQADIANIIPDNCFQRRPPLVIGGAASAIPDRASLIRRRNENAWNQGRQPAFDWGDPPENE
jgi:hypothetical protein